MHKYLYQFVTENYIEVIVIKLRDIKFCVAVFFFFNYLHCNQQEIHFIRDSHYIKNDVLGRKQGIHT